MTFTSKQRAYLKSLAADLTPIFQIGKSGVSPEVTEAVGECFNTRELIKITVLKNCTEEMSVIASKVSERTHSNVVQTIGRKIILYKPFLEDPRIILPKN